MTEESGFDSQQGQEIFSLLHNVQTDFGAHPDSYPMDNTDSQV